MPNNIGVRSPYFLTVQYSTGVSFELRITINGTLRYELLKDGAGSATFEIAELIRDYINISYNGTMPTASDYTTNSNGYIADVSLGWNGFDSGGSVVNPGGVSLVAYDAYKLFDENYYNYTYPSTAVLLTSKTVWLPQNTAGTFYYNSTTNLTKYDITTSAVGNVTVAGETVTIKRQDCSKYEPTKLVFVNRFGILQELWFFGKTTESASSNSEQYKSSNIAANGSYNRYEHQFKRFNSNGKKRYVVNSGFVDEGYNDSINELMLSEQVWMHIDNNVIPVNVLTSDVTYKTSLNDRLVQHTLEVEQAYDLISTMR